jgi:hypothetical protein
MPWTNNIGLCVVSLVPFLNSLLQVPPLFLRVSNICRLARLLVLRWKFFLPIVGEFQVRDYVETISAFGSPVTRTYTLHVANNNFPDGNQPPEEAQILGWNNYTNGEWCFLIMRS